MNPSPYLNSVNLNQHTTFPYLVLDVVNDSAYPRNPGFQVMHWHEDLQFIYVLSGKIEVVTLEACVAMDAGEGLFINKNTVHLVRKMDFCHYNSFIFPDYFLKFYTGNPAANVVEQLVGRADFPVCKIENQSKNHAVLDALQRLARIETNKTSLYEYEVLVALCDLWLKFRQSITVSGSTAVSHIISERMRLFLRHIEQHYDEPISLELLAKSANVSKSECLRCFTASLQTSPYKYLTEYRLSKAAELLRTTDEPIGDIAARVGFQQASHFGKCFREKIGLSPSEYRKQSFTDTSNSAE